MTNTPTSISKVLKDNVLLVTERQELSSGETLDLVIEVASDSRYDFFVEIANGSAKQSARFMVADNVEYNNGDEVDISTSVIDDAIYEGTDVTAITNVILSAEDTRYQQEISGGSGGGNRVAGTGRFTQALITAGHNYAVQVENNSGQSNFSSVNIRLWKINRTK